jgi:hypothetical protein
MPDEYPFLPAFFNVAGPRIPGRHYMIPAPERRPAACSIVLRGLKKIR